MTGKPTHSASRESNGAVYPGHIKCHLKDTLFSPMSNSLYNSSTLELFKKINTSALVTTKNTHNCVMQRKLSYATIKLTLFTVNKKMNGTQRRAVVMNRKKLF